MGTLHFSAMVLAFSLLPYARMLSGDGPIKINPLLITFSANSEFSDKKLQSIEEKFSQTDTIFTVSVNYSGKVPQWEELAATAMAVQNMYLTCTAHEVGCYWSTPKEAEYLKDFLKLEDNQMCLGLFYMGKL